MDQFIHGGFEREQSPYGARRTHVGRGGEVELRDLTRKADVLAMLELARPAVPAFCRRS